MPDPAALDLLARKQYGLATYAQLVAAGFSRHVVERLVSSGRLIRVRHGVYRLCGVPPSWRASALAAVLAAGPGAVLSHRSAAALWRLIDHHEVGGSFEVTARGRHLLEGVTAHRHQLEPNEVCVRDWVPVTTVERTLIDLAETEPGIGDHLDLALRLRLTSVRRLEAAAARRARPGRRRSKALVEALATRGPGYDPGANTWEQRMDRWWDAAGLPPAERQHKIRLCGRTYKLDRAILSSKVAVEWNGRTVHGSRSGFERDTERRARLTAAGWCVLEFTPRSTADFIRTTVLAVHEARAAKEAEQRTR